MEKFIFCAARDTLLDKKERARKTNTSFIAGFGPRTCGISKIAFNHAPFPENFQSI